MDIGEFTRTILFPRRLSGANDRHKRFALEDTVAPRRPDVPLYQLEDDRFDRPPPPTIKVVGIGNSGCNAVCRNDRRPMTGVDFLGVNTDAPSLARMDSIPRLLIGRAATRGAGAGGNVETGLLAVEESRFELGHSIGNAEIVFVCAGLGGGTGTGGAPLVADIAKSAGALTIGVVTRPFSFEGEKRHRQADDGIARLRRSVDVLIVVSNDRLLRVCPGKATISEAFRVADDILFRAVQCMAELVTVPGMIMTRANDLRVHLRGAGEGYVGLGRGRDHGCARGAAEAALTSPLLEVGIESARRVLLTVATKHSVEIDEIRTAMQVVAEAVHPDARIVYGTSVNPDLMDDMEITIIAAAFGRPTGGIDT